MALEVLQEAEQGGFYVFVVFNEFAGCFALLLRKLLAVAVETVEESDASDLAGLHDGLLGREAACRDDLL